MLDTRPLLLETDFPAINRTTLDTLQVNLGYLCNLSCTHCHVNAGPTRKELMTKEHIDLVVTFLKEKQIRTLDLTGGAPEMNPHFEYLVEQARALGVHVMDRCNLTILQEPGYEGLVQFLANNQVEIVASLPCYTADNVDAQRGKGVFDDSVTSLKLLNAHGYGMGNESLTLSLVYNPGGAFLPPAQQGLEQDYKRELDEHFGIKFDQLYTIANMPISRFGSVLLSKGEFDNYMSLLKGAYSQNNLDSVMCKNLISIDWQGFVYDCDFNQMLDLPLQHKDSQIIASDGHKTHLSELLKQNLEGQAIQIADHCYGCTAGQGSSCGGALD